MNRRSFLKACGGVFGVALVGLPKMTASAPTPFMPDAKITLKEMRNSGGYLNTEQTEAFIATLNERPLRVRYCRYQEGDRVIYKGQIYACKEEAWQSMRKV